MQCVMEERLSGWVESLDPSKSELILRSEGKRHRVIIKKQNLLKKIVPKDGSETFIRVKIAGSDDEGGVVADDIELVHYGMVKPDYGSIDPSRPADFARRSYIAIRLPKYQKVLRIQHTIMRYFREFLDSKGFIELLPPMISTTSDPGLRGARKLRTELYGVTYELTSSTIMFKQVAASSLGKIYFMARNVREEPPEHIATWRHLVEFTQLDLEWGGATMEDVMKLGEDLIYYTCKRLAEEHYDTLVEFRGDFHCPKPPFKRITYKEAIKLEKKLGLPVADGKELSQKAEEAISLEIGEPFWLTNFPAKSRGFYYLPDSQDSSINRDFNLILPQGYGEVIDGGEREYRYEAVVDRIKALGESLDKYGWFLDALRIGIAPSAGFGLGVERFTRYVLGLKYVWEAVPFPKPPGVTHTP